MAVVIRISGLGTGFTHKPITHTGITGFIHKPI